MTRQERLGRLLRNGKLKKTRISTCRARRRRPMGTSDQVQVRISSEAGRFDHHVKTLANLYHPCTISLTGLFPKEHD